jgi:transcriptional regulator with XRE-family HTH domain
MPDSARRERGRRLLAARERAGFSQHYVAEQIECSRQLIGVIERTGKLSADQLASLCVLYGCSSDSILYGTAAEEASGDEFAAEFAKLSGPVRDRLWMVYQVFIRRGAQMAPAALPRD